MQLSIKPSGLQLALLTLLVSAVLQLACFARWPGSPSYDVAYSIFAAQNLVSHGQLRALNSLSDYGDDLAQFARLRWMVHFPPGHSLLYAAVFGLGFSAGVATKVLGFAGIVTGGTGWICLARYLRASSGCTQFLGAVYPWLPWTGVVYQAYESEHVAFALMPWFCLTLLRIEPVAPRGEPNSQGSAGRQERDFSIAISLALLLVTVKYSMSPVFLAISLFLLFQDGARFVARPLWWKVAVFAFLLIPGLLFLAVNYAYGPRIHLAGAQNVHFGLKFARAIFNTTISGTLGWEKFLLSHAPHASIFINLLSLFSLAAFVMHFRRFPLQGRLRTFAILLVFLTVALWLLLFVATYLGGGQWNFGAQPRLYIPITLLWLLCLIISLDRMPVRHLMRSPALHVLALAIGLSFATQVRNGLLKTPFPAMPQSGIAWRASADPRHAAYLSAYASSHGRKPDLVIASSVVMDELSVPSIYDSYWMPPGHHYWSSRPLEVWAVVVPSLEKQLQADFSGAALERVATPPRFPFVFYVIRMSPTRKPHV